MILEDEFEPENVFRLIKQSCEAAMAALNKNDISDYLITVPDRPTKQFSRKQAGELLGNIDEAEKQLRDYYPHADESYQIVEGIISTTRLSMPSSKQYSKRENLNPFKEGMAKSGKLMRGCMYTYTVDDAGMIHGEREWNTSSQMLYAWLYSLDQCGITTYFTMNSTETAKLLVAIHNYTEKGTHNTLNRYIKPSLHLVAKNRMELTKQDKQILSLMGLEGAGLGEAKATALIKKFGDVMSVLNASEWELEEVPGIGRSYAGKIRASVRRTKG